MSPSWRPWRSTSGTRAGGSSDPRRACPPGAPLRADRRDAHRARPSACAGPRAVLVPRRSAPCVGPEALGMNDLLGVELHMVDSVETADRFLRWLSERRP